MELLAESLVRWQWPGGGWNCDPRATGRRSSFHESLAPAWGLFEYWRATGAPEARAAALRTAELFLQHRLFRSLATGAVIRRDWLTLHYPPYWHATPKALLSSRMQLTGDPRRRDALTVPTPWRRTAAGSPVATGGSRPAPCTARPAPSTGTIAPSDDHAQRVAVLGIDPSQTAAMNPSHHAQSQTSGA